MALALTLALMGASADPASAVTFTVSNVNNGGQGSLRSAIAAANNQAGADKIRFRIPGTGVKTISPTSQLPSIRDPVLVDGFTQTGASPNTRAVGNNAVLRVELNGTGAGEQTHGLRITSADSTIRGLVINRFGGPGVRLEGSAASGNRIRGNYIGTNANGSIDRGNGGSGVSISSPDNTVGGTASEARNILSGNEQRGVGIGLGADGNAVLGNYIGTDEDGLVDLGNSDEGVSIFAAAANIVGGTTSAARNVISGNGFSGVSIRSGGSRDNRVSGNFIGTDRDGTADVGNTQEGVRVAEFGSTVGGTGSGAGNRIAFNDGDGVAATSSTENSILSNFIFSNGGLGIDLLPDGVTTNDTDDPDTGANNRQNFPVINSATRSNANGFTTISGTLNSNPNQSFTIQCFIAVPDPSLHGEGQIPVAQTTVSETDGNGDYPFACATQVPVPGHRVTATATRTTTGDTSEFARNAVVFAVP